ncbi:hypothetical protein [Beduini massiliensis]|uniref:hypothetical protein n=1 Tax=Beduini massiliensis TaxID=1585974 RepID=UPI00059A8CC1|nr:hypothetical protein [Beduini massiliensis]
MKSTQNDLKKRGYVDTEELRQYQGTPHETLILWINDSDSVKRSIAANYLDALRKEDILLLIDQLKKEKSLYTRIAICEKLQTGNALTASLMVKELGKIGHNQYHALPKRGSAKKSYPLPRDLIARCLGKMDTAVFPILLEVLNTDDLSRISEVLDAIGFMVFYHPFLVTKENAKKVYSIFERYQNHPLLIWKGLTCLSAFPTKETNRILQSYVALPGILGLEAQRSLKLLMK